MRLPLSIIRTLSTTCFALGGMWAAAGVLHLVFGVAVTFPLLPPIDLGRVHVETAFATAFCFVVAGAVLGRRTARREVRALGPRLVPDDPSDTISSPEELGQVIAAGAGRKRSERT